MKSFTSNSLEETGKIAANWLSDITKKHADSAESVVVGLSGHLGAGKTAFVKEVARNLGIREDITSPTFVIMKIYDIKNERWYRLIHIDAYRLEKREELAALKLEDLISDPHNLIMIEWPENVGLRKDDLSEYLKFEVKEGNYHISID